VFTVLALSGVYVLMLFWRDRYEARSRFARRSRHGTAVRPPDRREWMLWVGDGVAPAGPDLIGRPVNIHGRTGKVVDATALMIQVEWD
jgi:hypothetical protein